MRQSGPPPRRSDARLAARWILLKQALGPDLVAEATRARWILLKQALGPDLVAKATGNEARLTGMSAPRTCFSGIHSTRKATWSNARLTGTSAPRTRFSGIQST